MILRVAAQLANTCIRAQKHVGEWPSALFLQVLGHRFTYYWFPGISYLARTDTRMDVMRTKDGQLILFHDMPVEKNLEKLTGSAALTRGFCRSLFDLGDRVPVGKLPI